MIQTHKNARANEYASFGDFCRIHVEQMNSLYLLSLLLTADPQKAEQCFISGFDDSVSHRFVFKERASFWARRSIILQAIRLSRPRPNNEGELNTKLLPSRGSVPTEVRTHPKFAGIVELDTFERFVFIMSLLEKYSVQECSLLLSCFRGDVNRARTAAIRHLASVLITGKRHADGAAFAVA
ncbi:MAG TPA: hypothetical protein VFE08_04370 [Candidatus Sulfotelmatobacter sp.]|jgi:hypothetical protein|nr:hypothetical protein [Candidatus Sulfotelmatobacter sp.]